MEMTEIHAHEAEISSHGRDTLSVTELPAANPPGNVTFRTVCSAVLQDDDHMAPSRGRYDLCINLLYFISIARSGEIVMTQTPGYISAFPGETVTISCRSSSSTYYSGISKYEVNWYQIKEGQPKLLLYFATTRQTGLPDRFSGTGSGNDFTLSIKGVTEDDAADYYCQSDYNLPLTQGCSNSDYTTPSDFLTLYVDSCAQIVLTQSPDLITVSPGETVTISCKASSGVYGNLHWYQQKSGQLQANRHTGVPDRFSGSGSGTDFTLTISGATEDDAADYYCQQVWSFPLTQ
ncbi:unnamed protein product [Ranitomeya imitator]|uniref:Ig-like domain-containing protein n=1 Tax=Ranitomeya imitator TaxID=111125 RepID=A0ABN9MFG3_9NEOB|nr:unnamed protein product [Ranitomeya imitator]